MAENRPDPHAPVLVIGLGRFGASIALTLEELGTDVLAVDSRDDLVQEYSAYLRGLVDLTGIPHSTPPVPPSISVLRSVRQGGDTKTRKSRRRIAIPSR